MKINIIGGGPAGLHFALLMKNSNPANEITVIERDGPNDTFGWGIVFSDQTFSYLKDADHESYKEIIGSCETWDNVDVVHRNQKITIRGNKFSGIGRLTFLKILQKRCFDLGVDIQFRTNATDVDKYRDCDLLVGADGSNSFVRDSYREFFQPSLDVRTNKYIWLGTNQLFHGLTLIFREDDADLFIAHSYKFNKSASTFVVECAKDTWKKAGFDRKTDEETCTYLAEIFKNDLARHPLLSNNFVKWLNFVVVKNRHWFHDNVVLLGDALHTAHFSIGSGTKLALEDAITLRKCFEASEVIETALREFEKVRKPRIDEYQEAAYESLLWFENVKDELQLDPVPFAYKVITRSKKVNYEKLKKRDPQFIAAYESSLR
jgi:anthraniloyl-CoA monooxygenase